MAQRDSSPVYYREIQKNAFLKRFPEESIGSKLLPLALKKPPLKPMWTQLCVHNGRTPYLEQYRDPISARAHRPLWRACLSSARHVTASVTPRDTEHDFLIDTREGPVRMLAPTWECMQDWVTTLRNKLHELKVLPLCENVYMCPPVAAPPRAAARDPTSPLPPTPPLPPVRVPGIDLTTVTRSAPLEPMPITPEPPEPEAPPTPAAEPDIDISNWDDASVPSTSQAPTSVAKICGQNICLDNSIFKRGGSDDSDSISSKDTDNTEDGQSERPANVTVIQVSNKEPPHTAIPVVGADCSVFDFGFKAGADFVNIVNTEQNSYGTVFEPEYGHLSLTTTVSLTGQVKEDEVYERLCMASTKPSPLPVRKLKEMQRKSSLPNLDCNSTYEYLFTSNNNISNASDKSTKANIVSHVTVSNNITSAPSNITSSNITPLAITAASSVTPNITTVTNLTPNSGNITSAGIHIALNSSNITSVASHTAPNSGNITSAGSHIALNSSNITSVASHTAPNSGNITSAGSHIALNSSNITSVASHTAPNSGNITSAGSHIALNSSNITSVASHTAPNSSNITSVASNISTSTSIGSNITITNTPVTVSTIGNNLRCTDAGGRNVDSNARGVRVERTHSQNAFDASASPRSERIEAKTNGRADKTEPQYKPIWKRGLTELSLLTRLRIGQVKRPESPARNSDSSRNGVNGASPEKVVHRSRPEARIDRTRRRSSSLSNGQSPPTPALRLQPLVCRQAAALAAQQRRGAALTHTLAPRDQPLFVDYERQVWMAWWGGGGARCGGRVGDRVVGLRATTPKDAAHAKQLVHSANRPVDILFHRVPLGKIFVVNKRDKESIGIKLDNECNIVSVEADSPAERAGIPPVGKWAVTEVNNRAVNLLKGGEDDMNRISFYGTEASVLVQPSALVKKLRAALKGNKSLLGLR